MKIYVTILILCVMPTLYAGRICVDSDVLVEKALDLTVRFEILHTKYKRKHISQEIKNHALEDLIKLHGEYKEYEEYFEKYMILGNKNLKEGFDSLARFLFKEKETILREGYLLVDDSSDEESESSGRSDDEYGLLITQPPSEGELDENEEDDIVRLSEELRLSD